MYTRGTAGIETADAGFHDTGSVRSARAMRSLIDGTPARQAAPSLATLRARRAEVIDVCARNGASNVSVFGSVARGEQDDESDLDLVVDIQQRRSLFDLAGLIDDLEALLGRPVNMVERSSSLR